MLAVTSDQVVAGATVAQSFMVLAGVVFAWRQIREVVSAREDQDRAYVAVFFEVHSDRREFPELTVRNFGRTAAYNVRITVDPPLRSSFDSEGFPITSVGMIKDGIPTLPPGASMSTLFDSTLERPKDWEQTYTATVTYEDRTSASHSDRFTLDLACHKGSVWIDRKTIHDVHKQLNDLVKEFKHLRSGFGAPMPIVVEQRATYIERKSTEAVKLKDRHEKHGPNRTEPSVPVRVDGGAVGAAAELPSSEPAGSPVGSGDRQTEIASRVVSQGPTATQDLTEEQ